MTRETLSLKCTVVKLQQKLKDKGILTFPLPIRAKYVLYVNLKNPKTITRSFIGGNRDSAIRLSHGKCL